MSERRMAPDTSSRNGLLKLAVLFLLPVLLASCSGGATGGARVPSDPEIFRVGEVEVRLYRDRDRMVRDLPPFFALLAATQVANKQILVHGYYDAANKRVYSIDDARVVLHEFKHYLEPEWRHGVEARRSEAQLINTSRQPAGEDAAASRLLTSVDAGDLFLAQ